MTIYPFHITAQCRKAFTLPGLNKLHHFGSHLTISFLNIHLPKADLLPRNLTYGFIQECELGSWEECGFLVKLWIHSGFGTTWLVLKLKHSGASLEARQELPKSKEGLASSKGNYFCQWQRNLYFPFLRNPADVSYSISYRNYIGHRKHICLYNLHSKVLENAEGEESSSFSLPAIPIPTQISD